MSRPDGPHSLRGAGASAVPAGIKQPSCGVAGELPATHGVRGRGEEGLGCLFTRGESPQGSGPMPAWRTGTVTRPPPSPGLVGEQVGSLGRGLVLRGHGKWGWTRVGVVPPRLALPASQTLSLARHFLKERKHRSPRSLSAGRQRARRWPGPGAHCTSHGRSPPRQAGDTPAVGLVTGSRLMQCARHGNDN